MFFYVRSPMMNFIDLISCRLNVALCNLKAVFILKEKFSSMLACLTTCSSCCFSYVPSVLISCQAVTASVSFLPDFPSSNNILDYMPRSTLGFSITTKGQIGLVCFLCSLRTYLCSCSASKISSLSSRRNVVFSTLPTFRFLLPTTQCSRLVTFCFALLKRSFYFCRMNVCAQIGRKPILSNFAFFPFWKR